jgi:hypothetical protein
MSYQHESNYRRGRFAKAELPLKKSNKSSLKGGFNLITQSGASTIDRFSPLRIAKRLYLNQEVSQSDDGYLDGIKYYHRIISFELATQELIPDCFFDPRYVFDEKIQKRNKDKLFAHKMKMLYGVPLEYDERYQTSESRVDDISKIWNPEWFPNYDQTSNDIFEYGNLDIKTNKEYIKLFEETARDLLSNIDLSTIDIIEMPDVVYSESVAPTADKLGTVYYKNKFKMKINPCRREVISVGNTNVRDTIVSSIAYRRYTQLIDKQLLEILPYLGYPGMGSTEKQLDAGLNRLAKKCFYWYCRDFKKEGITKPRYILSILLKILYKRTNLPAFRINPYDYFKVTENGIDITPKRGHGLGFANALTTLMQIVIHTMNIRKNNLNNCDAAFYNDDSVVGFSDSDDIYHDLVIYHETDYEILEGLGLVLNKKKSFFSDVGFVFCEEYYMRKKIDKVAINHYLSLAPDRAYSMTHRSEICRSLNIYDQYNHIKPGNYVEVNERWNPHIYLGFSKSRLQHIEAERVGRKLARRDLINRVRGINKDRIRRGFSAIFSEDETLKYNLKYRRDIVAWYYKKFDEHYNEQYTRLGKKENLIEYLLSLDGEIYINPSWDFTNFWNFDNSEVKVPANSGNLYPFFKARRIKVPNFVQKPAASKLVVSDETIWIEYQDELEEEVMIPNIVATYDEELYSKACKTIGKYFFSPKTKKKSFTDEERKFLENQRKYPILKYKYFDGENDNQLYRDIYLKLSVADEEQQQISEESVDSDLEEDRIFMEKVKNKEIDLAKELDELARKLKNEDIDDIESKSEEKIAILEDSSSDLEGYDSDEKLELELDQLKIEGDKFYSYKFCQLPKCKPLKWNKLRRILKNIIEKKPHKMKYAKWKIIEYLNFIRHWDLNPERGSEAYLMQKDYLKKINNLLIRNDEFSDWITMRSSIYSDADESSSDTFVGLLNTDDSSSTDNESS